MNLWVIDWVGRDVPSPATSPEIPEDVVVVADTHFVVVECSHDEAEALVRGYPYWRVTGHPRDGRWVGAGGEEVYIADGRVVEDPTELWEALGLRPENFDGESWDDVDEDVVWSYVPTF